MTQKRKSVRTAAGKTSGAKPKRKIAGGTLGAGVLCAVISLIMVSRGISVQPEINRDKAKIAELNAQIEQEKQHQAEVDEMNADENNDEYIEKIARERLGMIKSDEIVFIDVSEK